jgi:hypothetical protein
VRLGAHRQAGPGSGPVQPNRSASSRRRLRALKQASNSNAQPESGTRSETGYRSTPCLPRKSWTPDPPTVTVVAITRNAGACRQPEEWRQRLWPEADAHPHRRFQSGSGAGTGGPTRGESASRECAKKDWQKKSFTNEPTLDIKWHGCELLTSKLCLNLIMRSPQNNVRTPTGKLVKHRASKCLLLLVAASAAATVCHAQLTNPGFEDPTAFNGWSTTGHAVVLDSTTAVTPLGVNPVSGSRLAEISTTPTIFPQSTTLTAVETFLGLPSGTLGPNGFLNGSAIQSAAPFHALAGQQLSFSYDFATVEALPPSATRDDFAFAVITGVTGVNTVASVVTSSITETFSVGTLAGTEFNKGVGLATGTGWQTFTFPAFSATGDYVLGIGVADGGASHSGNSGLFIDNVNLTAVPEPKAWALVAGLSLCGVALARRIRKSGDFAG